MSTRLFAYAWVMLLMTSHTAYAGELAKATLSKDTTPLLDGRFTIQVPQDARVEARGHSIMAAPQSQAEETRIVLDAGDERFVIMTYELFATTGSDFEAAAKAYAKEYDIPTTVEALPNKAFAILPGEHDTSREAIFCLGVLIPHTDGSVIYQAFYVNPAGADDLDGVTALAKKIAATTTPDAKTLALDARTISFERDALKIDLPKGYVFTSQEGPDFGVYRFTQVAPLNDTGATIGVYVGGHPSYQYRQAQNRSSTGWEAKVTTQSAKFLNTDVEWQLWTTESGRLMAEAIVPLPGSDYLNIHVFVGAQDDASRDTAVQIANTLHTP